MHGPDLDRLAGPWGVHDLAVADVHADVVHAGRTGEHQVAGLELTARDAPEVGELAGRCPWQRDLEFGDLNLLGRERALHPVALLLDPGSLCDGGVPLFDQAGFGDLQGRGRCPQALQVGLLAARWTRRSNAVR